MDEAQMTCAAAFVEGGVQDACDDACSICLENFSENDPATITVCNHDYHLQCILEWSQRSKECPMCWQPLCLKDQDSQLLLAASEQERAQRHQRSPFYQRSTLDTEFHRFGPTFTEDSDLEDRIMHHLAAAAMGRAQQFNRRGESVRIRSSPGQGHPHCIIVPAHSNLPSSHLSSTIVSSAGNNGFLQPSPSSGHIDSSAVSTAQSTPLESTSISLMSEPVGGRIVENGSVETYSLRRQVLVDHVDGQQGTSSSELSLSESFKSRLVAASSRYRESLTRTTRGFRERLRARNGPIAELGTRAREVSAGVVRAIERMSLDSPDKHRDSSNTPISSPDADLDIGTVLVQSRLSHMPEWTNGTRHPSTSFGETEHAGGGTASSSRNASCQGGVGTSNRLASRPSNVSFHESTSTAMSSSGTNLHS